MTQVALEQSRLRLNNIQRYLTIWRTQAATEDILVGIRDQFHALKESTAAAGFDYASRLSHLLESLLAQTKLVSDDSSLLNLLEEMHDGLEAELDFIVKTNSDHLRALISMVQLLLADEPTTSTSTSKRSEETQNGGYGDPFQACFSEEAKQDFGEQCVEVLVDNQIIQHEQNSGQHEGVHELTDPIHLPVSPSTFHALLVKVGRYQVALLIPDIERVMRVHENEIQALNGQHHVTLAERPIRVVNLAMCLGETNIRADDGVRLLVVSCLSDGIVADRMIAFEVDKFQEVAEVVVKTVGSQFASIGGMVGVAVLADDSLALIPDLKQLSKQVFSA